MKIKDICIIGGSGFVGQHLAYFLTRQGGINLCVPTRHRERAKSLLVLPTVDVIEANIHDPGELDRLFVEKDAVINLVGILDGDFISVHAELPNKIVAACERNGVPRLLHLSALNANINGISAYLRSKGEGERIVKESNLRTTIFRPSVIFGPGDSFLNLFADLAQRLPVLPLALPNSKFQPVFVEDVVKAIAVSLFNSDTFYQSYNLCGPKVYSLRQIVEYVSVITGNKLNIIGLSDWLSYLQAIVLEFMPGNLMTRDNYLSMKIDSICDCNHESDLIAIFGIHPTELEKIAPLYLAHNKPRERYTGYRDRAGR